MTLGPLMIDLHGLDMQPEEREMLQHPLVGGLILFSRNFESVDQIKALIDSVQKNRRKPLLITVDHEGGAVQRFRNGFTRLPACAELGKIYDHDPQRALALSHDFGWVMAAELRAIGVDLSFAPVLDLGVGISHVINDRAFHKTPEGISKLALAYRHGMQDAGMAAVGKHFPGHGSVEADSHHAIPIDERDFTSIEQADLLPFQTMINNGLEAIMPAHVIYPQVDDRPAGFSPFWLQEVLRKRLGFQGVIFSDDISMAGAAVAGDFLQRTRAALSAGCDMVLLCNDQEGAISVLDNLGEVIEPVSQSRLIRLHGRGKTDLAELQTNDLWKQRTLAINQLSPDRELDLNDDGLM